MTHAWIGAIHRIVDGKGSRCTHFWRFWDFCQQCSTGLSYCRLRSFHMDFGQLHERVRLEVLRRISKGTMSVSLLARQTGLGQPHVSNFLRERRKLSLHALDLVLDVLRLRVEDLLPRQREAGSYKQDRLEIVPVVAAYAAMHDAYIRMSSVRWELKIARELLGAAEARCSSFRRSWDRYVAVQVDADEARGMTPVVMAGAIVVLDRQYLVFDAVREGETNLYAVRRIVPRRDEPKVRNAQKMKDAPQMRDTQLSIRYGKSLGEVAVLLGYAGSVDAEVVELGEEMAVEELLVGRVVAVVQGV